MQQNTDTEYRGEAKLLLSLSISHKLWPRNHLAIVLTLVGYSEAYETYRHGLHKHTIPQTTKAAHPPISK